MGSTSRCQRKLEEREVIGFLISLIKMWIMKRVNNKKKVFIPKFKTLLSLITTSKEEEMVYQRLLKKKLKDSDKVSK
jgi:sulfatase maturation enzyme AslB (radical SAM superfamily)